MVPALRITAANGAPIARGDYVLYWMIAARRAAWSFALDRAIEHAHALGRPLLVFEPLRTGYRWASDRLHAFVLQGMADNARAFAAAGVTYLPYVEPEPGAGSGLLAALARRACVIVTDEQPGFFLPRMVTAAASRLAVRVEQVDGNGLLPLRAAERAFPTAFGFRRFLERTLPVHAGERPRARPLTARGLRGAELPRGVASRWPKARAEMLAAEPAALARLPIDHTVAPVAWHGGASAAHARLAAFDVARYAEHRNDPDADATSGLSPYLHFGHISVHEVVDRVRRAKVSGDAFLDQLVTWRELGLGFCFHRRDFDRYTALPEWARRTLERHARDPRPVVYTRRALAEARTHDAVWNAAQRQLLVEGRIHNYLRMLWGKKILEWSSTPRAALATMIELNNRHALDGRDANSYSGILWTLGLFDRAWGPERPIFGTVRYMSSDQARRKLHLRAYLERWSGPDDLDR